MVEQEKDHESQWAAIKSVARKIGCTAETLRKWVRQEERAGGRRGGPSTEEQRRIKELKVEIQRVWEKNQSVCGPVHLPWGPWPPAPRYDPFPGQQQPKKRRPADVPTIPGIEGPYRLFFHSFDCRGPMHVHVERDNST